MEREFRGLELFPEETEHFLILMQNNKGDQEGSSG
jgi:hypothetical protein